MVVKRGAKSVLAGLPIYSSEASRIFLADSSSIAPNSSALAILNDSSIPFLSNGLVCTDADCASVGGSSLTLLLVNVRNIPKTAPS